MGMKMKMDEEFGPDRGMGFETDDEENQASRNNDDDDEEDESESSDCMNPSSPNASINFMDDDNPSWPQSYRRSIDMLSRTPPISEFIGGSFKSSGSFLTSAYQRHQSITADPALHKSFLSPPIEEKDEEVPQSVHPRKSSSKFSSGIFHGESPTTGQCSFSQSLLNVTNALCGIGLLSTPYALKGGWLSLLILVVMGVIACYTGILLRRCLDSSPGLKTYPDIGQAAFGITGRVCIAIVLYLELYSSCVEYIIMMADNLTNLFPNIGLNLAGVVLKSPQVFAVASTLIILPTVWLRNLSLLSYISVGGVIASLLLTLCLLWVGVVDQVGFRPSGTAFDLAQLPVTIGILGFSFGGHSVFPNIVSSMKKPSQYPLILVISFVGSLILYAGVGICGFLMFGNAIESQFTLNMPTDFVATKIAAWTTVVNPITKYALTITPIAYSLEELLPSPQLRSSRGMSILIRTVLVLSTLVVALTIPFFESVMALIGSLLVMIVALVVPCVCYLKLLRGKLTKLQIGVCISIIVIGLTCSILGTYTSVKSIVDKMA